MTCYHEFIGGIHICGLPSADPIHWNSNTNFYHPFQATATTVTANEVRTTMPDALFASLPEEPDGP